MIDFNEMIEKPLNEFKGGIGTIFAKIHDDGIAKVMRLRVPKGCSIGKHTHINQCEVVFVLEGEMTFIIDEKYETIKKGMSHFCKNGSTHECKNLGDRDVIMLCCVPEFK